MTKVSTIHRTAQAGNAHVHRTTSNEAFEKLNGLLEEYDWFRLQAHQMLLDYSERLKEISTPLLEESMKVQGWHPDCGVPIDMMGGYYSAQHEAVQLAAGGLNGLDTAMRQARTLALLLSKWEG